MASDPIPQFTPLKKNSKSNPIERESSMTVDFGDLWEKFDERTSQLLTFAKSTNKKAQSASDAALAATVRLDEHSRWMQSLDEALKAGHPCSQQKTIDSLQEQVAGGLKLQNQNIQDDIKTRNLAQTVKEDMDKFIRDAKEREKESRVSWRWFWGSIMSIILFVVSGGLATVWYFGQLDERVTQQNAHQVEAIERVETQVKNVGQQVRELDNGSNIDRLIRAVVESNGHQTIEQWCSSLDDRSVASIKRTTPRGHWPRCARFR